MANQITGKIIEIGQTVQIPSKNGGSSFTKREFILDATLMTLIRVSVASMRIFFLQSFLEINVLILIVLVKVMLLPCHSYYKDVLGLIRLESLNVWRPFGAIKQKGVAVYPSPHKLHQYNHHSRLIISRRIFRLRLMRMVMLKMTFLFNLCQQHRYVPYQ